MADFPVDFVIPYVNSMVKSWQDNYIKFCKENGYQDRLAALNNERFRDWGFLKYLFRGIDRNLPFIRKVFLLLQDEHQIPTWLKTEEVEIIYHKDFIPEKYLPTYNSTSIEMFLDKIPGLSEHFIYANDDIYAMKPMVAENFFSEDGLSVKIGFRQRMLKKPLLQFDLVCNTCFNMIQRKLIARDTTPNYLTPYHEFVPMIKSHVAKVNEMFWGEIEKGITPFRNVKNHNQYIYSYYEFFTKNTLQPDRDYIYYNMEDNAESVRKVIVEAPCDTLVLNDSEKTNVQLWGGNQDILTAFEYRWPGMSRFEFRPRVSICIPAYNAAQFIERCLSTIPKRDDVEVVIINDASQDNTLEVIDKLISSYPKFQILSCKQNMGVGFCRNVLMDRANGDYIFFLDSDDWLVTDEFVKVLDGILKEQNILTPKYIRNDGFSGYPNILRGCFIKKSYIGQVRHDPAIRCFEDVNFKNQLKQAKGGQIDEEKIDTILYHYDLPRKGSITWEHWKERGLAAYQRGADTWEKWFKGKPR